MNLGNVIAGSEEEIRKQKTKEYQKQWRLKNKEYQKQWNLKNKEKRRAFSKRWYWKQTQNPIALAELRKKIKEYYEKNKDIILTKKREYRKTEKGKLQLKYYNLKKGKKIKAEWFQKNKRELQLRKTNRLKTDPNFKMKHYLSTRIRAVLKGNLKSKSTIKLLGCTVEQIWQHLESKFQPGMTRENHGKWHVDHIRPCISFDLTKPEEQAKCFHYTNLQPLWAHENISKGAKYDPEL